MNKKGFILPFTLIVLSLVLSVFHLFNLSLNSRVSLNLLQEKNRILKSDFMNMNNIINYELEIMSNYIKNGEIENIDQYFFHSLSGDPIWSNKDLRNKKSIGGYYIVKISPPIETLNMGNKSDIEIFFHKKMEITDENNNKYMTLTMKLDKIKMKCILLNSKKDLKCELEERAIENIRVVGEL